MSFKLNPGVIKSENFDPKKLSIQLPTDKTSQYIQTLYDGKPNIKLAFCAGKDHGSLMSRGFMIQDTSKFDKKDDSKKEKNETLSVTLPISGCYMQSRNKFESELVDTMFTIRKTLVNCVFADALPIFKKASNIDIVDERIAWSPITFNKVEHQGVKIENRDDPKVTLWLKMPKYYPKDLTKKIEAVQDKDVNEALNKIKDIIFNSNKCKVFQIREDGTIAKYFVLDEALQTKQEELEIVSLVLDIGPLFKIADKLYPQIILNEVYVKQGYKHLPYLTYIPPISDINVNSDEEEEEEDVVEEDFSSAKKKLKV